MKPSKTKVPTWTSQVEEALQRADDFLSARALTALVAPQRPNWEGKPAPAAYHNVSSALWHLQKYKVVDCVKDAAGQLHWFYVGEAHDARLFIREEITPEGRPRRKRLAGSVRKRGEL